jgi:hypothetical protein
MMLSNARWRGVATIARPWPAKAAKATARHSFMM